MTAQSIQLASVRLITDDLAAVVRFYEVLTGVTARYLTDDFAEVITPSATLGISAAARVAFILDDTPRGGANNSAFVEFLVEDVDAVHRRLVGEYGDTLTVLQEPATMPWGNRSLLLRDPEGTPVNIYAPVTAAGIALQQSRTPPMVQRPAPRRVDIMSIIGARRRSWNRPGGRSACCRRRDARAVIAGRIGHPSVPAAACSPGRCAAPFTRRDATRHMCRRIGPSRPAARSEHTGVTPGPTPERPPSKVAHVMSTAHGRRVTGPEAARSRQRTSSPSIVSRFPLHS